MRPSKRMISASVALTALTSVTAALVSAQSPDSAVVQGRQADKATLGAVVVTATRTSKPANDLPANVAVLSAEVIGTSAAKSVADFLRVLPGFTTRDFQSTLVSHPAAQAPALRGMGGTSASRTLVLLDGVPINDPFAGWVHWSRIPLALVKQAEVVRGGGSAVWGDRALAGVINLITEDPLANKLLLSASGGSFGTVRTSASGTFRRKRLGALFAGEYFQTDGYSNVRRELRGPIDANLDSRDVVLYTKVLYDVTPLFRVQLAGSYLDDFRHNGTALKTVGTSISDLRGGLRLVTRGGSLLTATTYASVQSFSSFNSSESPDRATEVPALDQFDVPATAFGTQLQWSKQVFHRHQLTAGADLSWVDGEVNEDFSYVQGSFSRRRRVGGQQLLGGAYLQDAVTFGERWRLLASVRYDTWQNRNAVRIERDLSADRVLLDSSFAGANDSKISYSAGLRHQTSNALSLRGSVYTSFRSPTLNELYKPFRESGNVITEANSGLRPERLTGAEIGADYTFSPLLLGRVTVFRNRVRDPILEVTVSPAGATGRTISPCGFVPAGGACRQRKNIDEFRTDGVEAELEARPHRYWSVRGSYLWNPTKITEASEHPVLVGKVARGAARQQFTAILAYDNPAIIGIGVTTRFVGSRFDDDLSTLELDRFHVTDVRVNRQVTRRSSLFLTVENLFDKEYDVRRATSGLVRIGGPRFIDGGVRYQW